MKRKIADQDFAPTAEIRTTGATLTGILSSSRTVKTKFGDKPVYALKVLDGDCKFTIGKEKAEAFPEQGDEVEIMPTTRLARQLAKVNVGETVKITYLGVGKNVRGNPPHLFDVEVQ